MSFRLKLFLSQLAVILAVVWGLDYFIARELKARLLEDMQSDLSRQAAMVGEFLRRVPSTPAGELPFDPTADRLGEVLGARVTLIGKDGAVLGDSDVETERLPSIENHLFRPEVQTALREGTGRSVRFSTTVRNDLIYVAWLNAEKTSPVRIVRLATELSRYREMLARWRQAMAAASAIGILAAAALAYWISGRFGDRVARMAEFTARVASGEPAHSTEAPHRNDELGRLDTSLRQMARTIREKLQALAYESSRRDAILRSMSEGIAAWSAEGKLLLANPAFEQMFGPDTKPSPSGPIESLREAAAISLYDAALNQRTPSEGEVHLQPSGRRLYCTFTPLPRPPGPEERNSGGIEGVLGVFQDVTQLRRLEEIRRDFVLNAAHELKTPLSSILGFSETLLHAAPADPATGRSFLERIRANAVRLGRIVDDLLTLGRIESGAWPLEIKTIDLRDLVQRILETLRPDVERMRLRIQVDIPESARRLQADEFAMEQILLNLLDNAIKYNRESGRITVRVTPHEGGVEIRVQDTGAGIPRADLPRVFERFYRVDKARSRELGGTGLGLAIVKHLVMAHGGSVTVESEPERGSCFTVRFPSPPTS